MYNLRIELGKKVYYNVELGNAYIKADLADCDPKLKLGMNFHEILSTIYQNGEFAPSVAIFKNGHPTLLDYLDFNEIFEDMDLPDSVRCWIMNGTGDTIETFTVVNIAGENDEVENPDDDFNAITLD